MGTVIHPDGSVVVRLAAQTILIDPGTRAIHVRAPSLDGDFQGKILQTYPMAAAHKVRIVGDGASFELVLDLLSGTSIPLGQSRTRDAAMITARAVADLTRCRVEVSQGVVADLPGPSEAFSDNETFDQVLIVAREDPHEEPTGPIPLPPIEPTEITPDDACLETPALSVTHWTEDPTPTDPPRLVAPPIGHEGGTPDSVTTEPEGVWEPAKTPVTGLPRIDSSRPAVSDSSPGH